MKHHPGMKAALTTAAVLAALVSVGSASASDYSFMSRAGAESGMVGEPGPHEYGIYFRGQLGGSFALTRVRPSGDGNFAIQGGGLAFGAMLGGIVAPGTAVHATFAGVTVPSPKVRVDGSITSFDDLGIEGQLTQMLLGAGFTTHMPSGTFVSLSAGAQSNRLRGRFEGFGASETSVDWGVGLNGQLGYEWMLSRSFGVGFALDGGGFYIPNVGGSDDPATGFNLGAVVMFTIN